MERRALPLRYKLRRVNVQLAAADRSVPVRNAAVPLWSAARRSLPVLFAASAVVSAASVLDLIPVGARGRDVAFGLGIAGRMAELAASAAVEHDAHAMRLAARPLRAGPSGILWNAASLCAVTGLAVSLMPRNSRARRITTGALGLAGGACAGFAIWLAGKRTA